MLIRAIRDLDAWFRPWMLVFQQAPFPTFTVIDGIGLGGVLQFDIILAVYFPRLEGFVVPRTFVRDALASSLVTVAGELVSDGAGHDSPGAGQMQVENWRRGYEETEEQFDLDPSDESQIIIWYDVNEIRNDSRRQISDLQVKSGARLWDETTVMTDAIQGMIPIPNKAHTRTFFSVGIWTFHKMIIGVVSRRKSKMTLK